MVHNVDEFEISGSDCIRHARRLLNGFEDGEVTAIEFKVHKSQPDPKQSRQTLNQKENARKPKLIKRNTSHHAVLHTLHEVGGDEDFVLGRIVRKHAEGVSDSSVFPALTQLWERQLVDRERDSDGSYAYQINEHGMDMLSELGEPTVDKGD